MSKVLNVRIPDELLDRIDATAAAEGTTRTAITLRLLSANLAEYDNQMASLAEQVSEDRAALFERLKVDEHQTFTLRQLVEWIGASR